MQRPTSNFHLMAKPAGAACNLGCQYCFFLSKENLYPGVSTLMSESILEKYIQQLIESSSGPEVHIAWQGGEPMLRGIEFYRRSVEFACKYRKSHQGIVHSLQTNGTLIDDEWAAFFKANNFLVGLSIDGPRELHDAYRIDRASKGSFETVLRGWEILRKHDVDVNILCSVHAANQNYPLEVYRFFRDELEARFIQFIPIVERATANNVALAEKGWGGQKGTDRPLYRQEGNLVTTRTVGAEQFGRFLNAIFDEWIGNDVGNIYVTTFEVALGSWMGHHSLCIVAPTCGKALAMERNGDVYSCDHYVEPKYLLGNIEKTHLSVLVSSERQEYFGRDKYNTLPKYCKECPVLFACYGECPRNRFIKTPDGDDGLNYLCAGYKSFFLHIRESMERLVQLLRQGRPADEIMRPPSASF